HLGDQIGDGDAGPVVTGGSAGIVGGGIGRDVGVRLVVGGAGAVAGEITEIPAALPRRGAWCGPRTSGKPLVYRIVGTFRMRSPAVRSGVVAVTHVLNGLRLCVRGASRCTSAALRNVALSDFSENPAPGQASPLKPPSTANPWYSGIRKSEVSELSRNRHESATGVHDVRAGGHRAVVRIVQPALGQRHRRRRSL